MNDIFYQDKNQIFIVKLKQSIYIQMINCCDKANPFETGGILIGNYSFGQNLANISRITIPVKDFKHYRYNFYRTSKDLRYLLDKLWEKGQYYLGEWHYHPNFNSTPSTIDKKQMILLSNDKYLKCPEPILIVIGGNKIKWNLSICVFCNGNCLNLHQM